jgi:hypothetical protein
MHVATIVTADTIRRRDRELTARKWTRPRRRTGRSGLRPDIRSLVVRMATDNATWGYTRIQGALKNLDHCVGRSTIARILKAHGVPPSRQRPTAWRPFVRAHWSALRIADMFTTFRGSITCSAAPTSERHRRTAGSLNVAAGRGSPASGYAAIGDEGDCGLKSVHGARGAGVDEGRWRGSVARHSGCIRAPDTVPRRELRHRCRGVHAPDDGGMQSSRLAPWEEASPAGTREFGARYHRERTHQAPQVLEPSGDEGRAGSNHSGTGRVTRTCPQRSATCT